MSSSLFKKRVAKNLRRKRDDSDEEETKSNGEEVSSQKNNESSRGSTPASVKSSGENSRSSAMPAVKSGVLLTFGDEENNEEETFQVKKSAHSRKFEKLRQKMRAKDEKLNANLSSTTNKKSNEKSSPKKDDATIFLSGKDAEALDFAEEDDESSNFRKALTRSDDENDDEFDRWEREQIRKGVSQQQLSSYQQEQMAAAGYYVPSSMYSQFQQQLYVAGGSTTTHVINLTDSPPTSADVKEPQPMDLDIELPVSEDVDVVHSSLSSVVKGCAPLPKIGGAGEVESTKKSLNLCSIRSKIKERCDENESLCRSLKLDEEKLRQHASENETMIEKLESSAPKLSEQFEFYQEIRAYVRDLLDCFDEKMPIIEQLELRALNLFQNRTNFIIRRRQQDVRDQFDECSAAALAKNQTVQDPDRMMRAAEREARKTRRRQAREKSLVGIGHHDGMSSDDEEAPSRIANFVAEKEKISVEAGEIFSDAVEDFCRVENIVECFLRWRKQDYDAYEQAFVDLCMPKLLSPLIRLEMILWNPVDAEFNDLDKFSWFQILRRLTADYCSQFPDDTSKRNDVGFLIPSVIEKVVCPKLTEFTTKVWDAASTTQNERLSSLIRRVKKDFSFENNNEEDGNKNFQTLLDAVVKRIRTSLDDDLFTPIYSKDVLESKTVGAAIFTERQFWFALKFMKSILNWDGVLPTSTVQELMLDGVLNRHLVLALQCSVAIESSTLLKCKSLCQVFPAGWTKKNESLGQLEPLLKVLVRIADEIGKSKSDKVQTEKIKEIHRLLVKLGDSRYSSIIAEKYRLH